MISAAKIHFNACLGEGLCKQKAPGSFRAGEGMDLQPLKSQVQKWCCSITDQGRGDVKSILITKLMWSLLWVGKKEDVEDWVSSCLCCQQSKAPHKEVWRSLWEKTPLPAPPECLVQVALKEPLPEIAVNNKDLLMFHNYFLKYLIAAAVPNTRNWQILNTQ